MQQARVRRRAVVRGVVQGVGFRWSCAQQAARAGVDGWVRNRPDGAVELVVEGDEAQVAAVLAFAQHGPRGTRVDGVDVHDEPPEGLVGFEVEP